MSLSTLAPQPAALIPLLHWRGAIPWLLDLDNSQTGWAISLVLTRQGECCLLPLAWLRDAPNWDDDRFTPIPHTYSTAFAADALDSETLHLALADLEGEGWEVSGRLDAHFTGRLADPDFWPNLHSYLWQPASGAKDGV